jgi:hypothetical protein
MRDRKPEPIPTKYRARNSIKERAHAHYKLAAAGALPYVRVSSTLRIAEPDLIAFVVAAPRLPENGRP